MDGTIIGLRPAAEVADVSPETVRLWCVKHKIGTMVNGVWHVNKKRLLKVSRAHNLVFGS